MLNSRFLLLWLLVTGLSRSGAKNTTANKNAALFLVNF